MPPAAIAVPVATFLGAGTITATTAVIGAAVAGAVYGAVIGAATSLVTGKNVLKGAMTGAAVGGVTAGVLQGVGAVDFLAKPVTSAGTSAGTSAATKSVSAGVHEGLVQGTGQAVGAGEAAGGQGLLDATGRTLASGAKSVTETAAPEVAKKAMSPETANLWGGAISGIGSGAGKVGAAMMDAETAKDLAETTRKYDIDRTNRNVPGVAPRSIVNITLPERWASLTDMSAALNKYKQPLEQNQGLLSRTV